MESLHTCFLASKRARNEPTVCVFSFKEKRWNITLGTCEAPQKPRAAESFFFVFSRKEKKVANQTRWKKPATVESDRGLIRNSRIPWRSCNIGPGLGPWIFIGRKRNFWSCPEIVVDFDWSLNATKFWSFHCEVCMCWLRHWIHEN